MIGLEVERKFCLPMVSTWPTANVINFRDIFRAIAERRRLCNITSPGYIQVSDITTIFQDQFDATKPNYGARQVSLSQMS